ncbi:serine/threonine-protein kinase [Actinoplanes utahensis]|uniref:serine/threonine-protein kinase n=1 Tax=Actinoplanes utahensis TaxID=1869 RepID=UPI0006905BD6|nr:serine/threonine-protein kinase [Actinoplanes utahensis]GIF27290.1 hypothetical protein Aut01nite_02760 [Actinoplanes utahensis]
MLNRGDLLDGRFHLRERLGAGGMSVVWRARDEVLGRDVAVKVMSAGHDTALMARIRDEARAIARLRHPGIVEVYDYGEAPGPLPYVVMEVVEGRTLEDLLAGGALPWRLAVLIGAQVAAALAAAHDRGVVHRDVKPANVVVAGDRVKLVDFGIAAVSGDDDRPAGLLLGTPAYLAPERWKGGVVRPAADVYAWGLLLYRALAGRLPWEAPATTRMLNAHRYQEPSPLPPIAGLPAEVADLCRRCLAESPAERPTAAEAASVLAGVAAPSGGTDAGVARRVTGPVRRRITPTRVIIEGAVVAGRLRSPRPRRRDRAGTGAAGILVAGAFLAAMGPGALGGLRAQAGPPVTPSAPPVVTAPTGPGCTVGYVVRAGAGHFTTEVGVTNTGTAPVTDVPFTFVLPGEASTSGSLSDSSLGEASLGEGAPGTWRQDGRTVTTRVTVAPGGRHTATISGTYQGGNATPRDFRLNGTTCRVTLSVAAATPPRTSSAPR